jgi:hypothetical protein
MIYFTCQAGSLIDSIEFLTFYPKYSITETEPILDSSNSILTVTGDVLLCHIEDKCIYVFSPIVATVPALRCVASTNGSFRSF